MAASTPDEQLMTALHRDHYDVLLAFASRYTGSREQAEDAVQETLLRAWQRIDAWRAPRCARTSSPWSATS
ncbi:sigma factor [Streptomyces sp. SPB074]|uniref:sigma factor n=1 Tax=Streptomyces sp. (strain SPB074) TaxID=465543 RepID=UPI0001D1DDD8|nr:sigma factor [Streptomyces sp. SPB074]EFG64823.1 hypothetical protein SSBG_05619 [Streptomyces sp. SPB074]